MFLRVTRNNKTGRERLTVIEGFRENGKVRQRVIKNIGDVDEFSSMYDDPLRHFRDEVKKMNEQAKKDSSYSLTIDLDETITCGNHMFNVGYLPLKYIYNECRLNDFCINKQKRMNISYSLNKNLELLVFSRILFPSSKKSTFENRDVFMAPFDRGITKDSVYSCLDVFDSLKEEIQTLLWNSTKDRYHRDCSKSYYDCTNYYFEIEYNDEDTYDKDGNLIEKGLRKRGPDPIVEMGLLMDATGIPMAFDIFPGNESEKQSLRLIVKKTKAHFGISKTIVVADRGLNTSDNIFYLAGINNDSEPKKDGYVYGQSVRGADKEFKEWVLDDKDYRMYCFEENGETIAFTHKSRLKAKEIKIVKDGKRKVKVTVYQKQMVYFSYKYLMKQRKERNRIIEKAKKMIRDPGGYTRATSYGAAAYISNIEYDRETGEIKTEKELILDEEKIREEERFDGYYSIVTSETELEDREIRNIYRGLAQIENSFKITKSNFRSRPAFVWTPPHIRGHFLTCFISLVIIRLLERKLGYRYSVDRIIESLKNYQCTNIDKIIYQFVYRDEIIDEISKAYDVDLSKKYRKREDIKKILKY